MSKTPDFNAPNLPAEWLAEGKDGLYQPPQSVWLTSDLEQYICPICNAPLLFEVSEWEADTGLPTEAGIMVWCELAYENYVGDVEDAPHENAGGMSLVSAAMQFYELCRKAQLKGKT